VQGTQGSLHFSCFLSKRFSFYFPDPLGHHRTFAVPPSSRLFLPFLGFRLTAKLHFTWAATFLTNGRNPSTHSRFSLEPCRQVNPQTSALFFSSSAVFCFRLPGLTPSLSQCTVQDVEDSFFVPPVCMYGSVALRAGPLKPCRFSSYRSPPSRTQPIGRSRQVFNSPPPRLFLFVSLSLHLFLTMFPSYFPSFFDLPPPMGTPACLEENLSPLPHACRSRARPPLFCALCPAAMKFEFEYSKTEPSPPLVLLFGLSHFERALERFVVHAFVPDDGVFLCRAIDCSAIAFFLYSQFPLHPPSSSQLRELSGSALPPLPGDGCRTIFLVLNALPSSLQSTRAFPRGQPPPRLFFPILRPAWPACVES